MKKSDLKTGMIVRFRNGLSGLVNFNETDREIKVTNEAYVSINAFQDDLTYNSTPIYDIMRVYNYIDEYRTAAGYECIWKRKEETKEMTVKEIEKELGYKIKIVGEDNA